MKNNKFIKITLISIIAFTLFYLFVIVFYNNVKILPSRLFREYSFEYYMNFPPYTNMEDIVVKISMMLKMFFLLIFTIEFIYMMSIKHYRDVIGKRFIIVNILLGVLAYLISFLLIKYLSTYYYLYMYLVPGQIIALTLLALIIRLRSSSIEIT